MLHKLLTQFLFILCCLPAASYAEDTTKTDTLSPEVDPISIIFTMFRWEGMFASLIVIFVSWIILHFAERLVDKLGTVFADRRLLIQKISAFFSFTVYIATIISVVLLSFKISNEILVILSGTGAVALGFALKDLAASLMAGIMILFDRPFQVGDRVLFNDQYGDVLAIGLRSVKIKTLDDSVVTIPNNLFLSEVSSCSNYGEVDMQIMVNFYIGLDQDIVKAREIIHEVAANTRFIYLPKPIKVIASQVVLESTVALKLTLKAYVLDTKYEKDFETDITLHVMKLFIEQGIQAPAVIHRTVADEPENTTEN